MPAAVAHTTALILAAFGLLLCLSVASSRAAGRFGVPLTLVFLLIGILAGSEGIGGIPFENYHVTFMIGTAALALILFDGGLNTPPSAIRQAVGPAAVLATVGVAGTAAATAVAAHVLGFAWPLAFLLGAIVSSTDAAAVFSALTASKTRLAHRIASLLEIESGFNDPMAVILTSALTTNLVAPGTLSTWAVARDVVVELAVGAVAGYLIGRAARWAMPRIRLPAVGLYPAFTLGVACLSFSLPALIGGSGFLAVYVAGATLGTGTLPHGVGVRRVHDALGWLSQIVMFLALGLLVFPTRLLAVGMSGLGIALFLAFIGRPVVVALCLAPFGYPIREVMYVGWVGLRGAVPIILATIPVIGGVAQGRELFDIVFFVVLIGSLIPGATVPWVTRALRLEPAGGGAPAASIEIDAPGPLTTEMRSFSVNRAAAVAGATLAEIPFPPGAAVSVIERAGELFAPSGATQLQIGDHVYVFARREDRAHIELLFGRPDAGDER